MYGPFAIHRLLAMSISSAQTLVKHMIENACEFLNEMKRTWVIEEYCSIVGKMVYACSLCKKKQTFTDHLDYVMHQIDAHGDRYMECNICTQNVQLQHFGLHKFKHFSDYMESESISCRRCTFVSPPMEFTHHLISYHNFKRQTACKKNLDKFVVGDKTFVALSILYTMKADDT